MAGSTPPIPGTTGAKFPSAPARTPSRGEFSRAPGGNQVRDIRGSFAGGFAINWVGLQVIVDELKDYQKQGAIAPGTIEQLAQEVQEYARNNAPWQDESGEARKGLVAEVQQRPNKETAIILSHSVHYGVYLENANGSVYAIIIPTLEHFADQLGTRIFGQGRPQ